MKIKKILVSQPKPANDKSPYFDLADRYNLQIDFRSFIKIEEVSAKEFRLQKVNLLDHTAVIFTSKTAIDNYFRIAEELRLTIPDTMKYFCVTESIALYLQKYIVYRKRKIFFGKKSIVDLIDVINKNKDENYLVPLSDKFKPDIPQTLDGNDIKWSKAILYRTVASDLSDLSNINYDVLVFYSPSGISSLLHNFPDFVQNDTKIASFGKHTAKAVHDAGLRLDIEAPMPAAPSMTMALDMFIKDFNKKK